MNSTVTGSWDASAVCVSAMMGGREEALRCCFWAGWHVGRLGMAGWRKFGKSVLKLVRLCGRLANRGRSARVVAKAYLYDMRLGSWAKSSQARLARYQPKPGQPAPCEPAALCEICEGASTSSVSQSSCTRTQSERAKSSPQN